MADVYGMVYPRMENQFAPSRVSARDIVKLRFVNGTRRAINHVAKADRVGRLGWPATLIQTILSLAFSLLAFGQASAAYLLDVAPDMLTFNERSGEAQSTVVPPGKKGECPKGRFLVSIDSRLRNPPANTLPPVTGLVIGRDLDDTSNTVIEATFGNVPDPASYQLSNDPDLITLANGDVLYLGHTRSFAPLTPKPPWFDVTYKFLGGTTYGPGARSIVLVWKSTDCGQTFHYVSQMDPARYEDGSCALPQMPPTGISPTDPPGSANRPVFGMGGGDGPLTKLDPGNGRLYMVFQCVGNVADTSQAYFNLSTTRLDKTLLLASYDNGAHWTSIGYFDNISSWRFGFAPLTNDQLAFGRGNKLFFGVKSGTRYLFDGSLLPAPQSAGWDQGGERFPQNPVLANVRSSYVGANILAYTLVARTPGSNNLVFIFPDTITDTDNKTSHGFRMYFYNTATKVFAEANPILPEVRSTNNFLMHPVIIDHGSGPLLLYWSDINGVSKRGTVRGRAIYGLGRYSPDFVISRVHGQKADWDISSGRYWYGDYQTASGFRVASGSTTGLVLAGKRYKYFPMWVQSDNTVRYTQVSITDLLQAKLPSLKPNKLLGIKLIRPEIWRPGPPPVTAANYKLTPYEQTLVNYGRNKEKVSFKLKLKKIVPAIQRLPVKKTDKKLQLKE